MNFAKILFCWLMIVAYFNFAFAQTQKPRRANDDFLQGRDLTKYSQEHFWCGGFRKSDDCNKEKMTNFVWECWNKKTLCYLTVSFNGVDSFYTKHFFIEPNKNNQWIILGYGQLSQPLNKPQVQLLPTAYFLELEEDKGEKILIFKNKQKKIIEKFLY